MRGETALSRPLGILIWRCVRGAPPRTGAISVNVNRIDESLRMQKTFVKKKTTSTEDFSRDHCKSMAGSKIKIVELNGRRCVKAKVAAERLNVSERRVLQFIADKRLESIQIEEGGAHYIPLESLEELEKVERPTGRPKKGGAKPKAKKSAKKLSKK